MINKSWLYLIHIYQGNLLIILLLILYNFDMNSLILYEVSLQEVELTIY